MKSDPANGGYRDVIDGMTIGANTLFATAASPKGEATEARLVVTNYPITLEKLSHKRITRNHRNTEALRISF